MFRCGITIQYILYTSLYVLSSIYCVIFCILVILSYTTNKHLYLILLNRSNILYPLLQLFFQIHSGLSFFFSQRCQLSPLNNKKNCQQFDYTAVNPTANVNQLETGHYCLCACDVTMVWYLCCGEIARPAHSTVCLSKASAMPKHLFC